MKWVIALVLVAVLLAVGIVPRLLTDARLADQARQVREQLPVVSVVHPHQVKTTTLSLPGGLQALESTAVGSRSSGYVARRLVDIGAKVRRGQLLALVSAPELEQSVQEARAQFVQSQAATSQARANEARGRASVAQARAAEVRARASLAASTQQEVAASRVLASSKANLRKLRANLELAHVTYERYAEMGKAGAASDQQVDEKRAAWEEARAAEDAGQATVSQTEAQLESARADVLAARADLVSAAESVRASLASLDADAAAVAAAGAAQQASLAGAERSATMQGYVRVEAPFDGVITARNVDVGSLVTGTGSTNADSTTPTSGLFGIARSDQIRAVAEVPEGVAARVHVGMEGVVEITDLPGETFKGKVWMRSGALNSGSRTLRVEVLLENPGLKAMPGMYCRVKMEVPGETWRVPSTALQVDATGTHIVLVEAGDVVKRVPVKVSRDLGKELELFYPFKGDERVVSDPGATLTDGMKVQIHKS